MYKSIIFLLFLASCSSTNTEHQYQAKTFNSKKVADFYSTRVGILPSNELLEFWDSNWKTREMISLFDIGKINILYPDQILDETLNAPPNYAQVTLSNTFYFKKKEGKMTEMAYDSLSRLMSNDPLLASQTVRKFYLTDAARQLKLSYAVVFARVNERAGLLFYGYDASKKLLGIFYYPHSQIQWPIYLAPNLTELIKSQGEIQNVDSYIENNANYFVKINSEKNQIEDFFEKSYKKVFGDSLIVNINSKQWEFTIIKYSENYIKFNIDSELGYKQRSQFILNALNMHAHNYRTPEFYSYYRIRNGYIGVLGSAVAIDFAKKGLIELEYFNQPIDVFLPSKRTDRKLLDSDEFRALDERSKQQYMKDFF